MAALKITKNMILDQKTSLITEAHKKLLNNNEIANLPTPFITCLLCVPIFLPCRYHSIRYAFCCFVLWALNKIDKLFAVTKAL